MGGDYLRNRCRHGCVIGHVQPSRGSLHPLTAQSLDNFNRTVHIKIGDNDLRSVPRHSHRSSATNPRAGPGNQGNLAFQHRESRRMGGCGLFNSHLDL
jgi:hypothetical protein